MGKLVCDLCGSDDLIKSEGVFVCQGCGAKYSVEEARQMMGVAAPAPAPTPEPAANEASPVQDLLMGLVGFLAQEAQKASAPQTPAEINNIVCDSWKKAVSEYKAIEHPTQEQHQVMVDRAKECLGALDAAALSQPDAVVQAAVIYTNCKEICSSARGLKYHVQNEKGEWDKKGLGAFDKMELPGQSASWDAKYQEQHDYLVADYLRQNPELLERRTQLSAQEAQLEEQLGELKDEKRGKGFFNFDAKREVKERMEPVKQELGQVRSQLREIENASDKHVRQLIEAMRSQMKLIDL